MLPGIGVFGTGNVVRVLVPCLRSKGFKVEAVWGPTVENAEEIAREMDISFYTNKVDEVLLRKGVDCVCIMCPPHLHSQIAVKALGIGKHVLCDRPAGLCQAEVVKMVSASQYYPSLISILCHTLRFLPAFVHMKKCIQDGYIGKITVCDVRVHCGSFVHDHYDWMCDEKMGGGILTNIGSHIIDILYFVTGLKAIRVHGMMCTFTKTMDHIKGIRHITSDDFCTIQMEMEKGAFATITLNSHLPGQFNQEVLICGTKGHVIIRGGDLYGQKADSLKEEVLYLDVEDMKQSVVQKSTLGTTLITEGLQNHLNRVLPKPYLKGLIKMISALKEAFVSVEANQQWIKEPVSSASTFEDGQYIQAVIDAVRQSSRNKEWIRVRLSTEDTDSNIIISKYMSGALLWQIFSLPNMYSIMLT